MSLEALQSFLDNSGWGYFLSLVVNGLTKGSIYALISLGYTMVYGVIELINFAHGEIYMIGAFTGLVAAGVLGFYGFPLAGTLVVAVIVAAIYCAAYGYTMERIAYRPLRKAQRLSPLISAIGMSIFLSNYVLLAQTPEFVRFPDLMPPMELGAAGAYLQPASVIIILTSAAMMISLTVFIKYTRMGKAMRATAQNRKMAMLLGINADTVISLTFVIGSALAAVGGILVASFTQQVSFGIGFLAGIKAFTAAVLGGIGSIPGAMLGGLVLGLCESIASGYGPSDYEDMFAFAVLILILIFRPSGILGKAKVEKV